MRKSPDSQLRQMAEASLLRLSDVPALIMDKEYILAMKSAGAEVVSSRPAIGTDFTNLFDRDCFSQTESGLSPVKQEHLMMEDLKIPVFVFGGNLSCGRYYAIVHEEGAMLDEEDELDPVLYREAAAEIAASTEKLLFTPITANGQDLLKNAARRLIRLKNYAKLTGEELTVKFGKAKGKMTLIHSLTELYLAKIGRILPTFGYSVSLECQTSKQLICRAAPRTFLSVITLFLFSLLSLSEDKSCRVIVALEEAADIRQSRIIRFSMICRGIPAIDDDPLKFLAEQALPFSLELRACRKLLETLSWQLSMRKENEESILSLAIPELIVPKLIFESPAKSNEPKIIDRLLEVYAPELALLA